MGIIVSIVLLFIGIYYHYKTKTWASPIAFFCYEWGLISLLASLRLFGMYAATEKTWLIIFIGSISYIFGVLSKLKIKGNQEELTENISELTPFLSAKSFLLLVIIVLAFSTGEFVQSLMLMRSGVSLDEIRLAGYGIIELAGFSRNVGYFVELFNSMIGALGIILTAAGIQVFFINPRRNKWYLIAVLLITIMKSFSNGGRFTLVYFVLELVACYSLYKKRGYENTIVISKRAKKVVIRLGVVVVSLIVVVTLLRGAEVSEWAKKYYRYICGNVLFFDKNIEIIDTAGIWSMSFAGFYGVWSVVFPLLNRLGFSYPDRYLNTINVVMNTQKYQRIGESMYTNAFITPFYHLYADFRWSGVIIGMFVIGYVAKSIYKLASYNWNAKYIVFYLVIIQTLFKTLQFYPMVNTDYVIAILVMLFICKSRRHILIKFN